MIEHSWGQRVVRFYDPDKHIIEAGENMQFIIDSELLKYNYIYGGVGNKNYTLKICPKALLEINNIIEQI